MGGTVWQLMPWRRRRTPLVPVLRLSGVIGAGGGLRRGLSLAGLAGAIDRAFRTSKAPAVALAINSPGGAPVQSALIAGRIRDLAEEHQKPVFAFVEDVAASGGYWLACSADEIYVDRASIVGSIGVVSAGFGLDRLIERYGIERRVHTAGRRKAILDPFAPERGEDVEKLKAIQADIHEAFKAQVRDRRGDRLKADEATLFDGEFWTGSAAVDLGLADGIGHMRGVLRKKFGPDVKMRLVGPSRPWWQRRFASRLFDWRFGESQSGGPSLPLPWSEMIDDVLTAVEERALWQRFGL